MRWSVSVSPEAEKQFSKLDRYTQRIVASWIDKHLDGCEDPRATGKPLSANLAGFWRYRIGDYRMIAKIEYSKIVILIVEIGHRREV
ncbi:MAG: type II toxin-antitoxin system RelE/ParE family toxin [Erysipelotrichaceae bacterium]|nr:type II toxin-antitoxin system RelE/ParE family toxin [Erysipelotrichaceae bacterium]